jgi:protein phosphatase
MKINYRAISDVGRKRKGNEDTVFVNFEHKLFVVADGMGGHAAGEVASRLAVESIERHIVGSDPRKEPTMPAGYRGAGGAGGTGGTAGTGRQAASLGDPARRQVAPLPDPARRLVNAIRLANQEIVRSVRKHREQRGMGTTVVTAFIRGARAFIGSVGDSRAYLVRGDRIRQLTSDHTFVNEQVRAGTLSDSEARRHPARNILTRAVGSQDEVEIDLVEQELRPGDWLLLCSDGLTTMVEDADILETIRAHPDSPEDGCRALIDLANDRGGEDNVTAVLVRILNGAS